MAKRGRPREFDRTAALRRGMEAFWELGYEGTKLTDLTAAMNISSASLYNTFGSKEQLFYEAVALYDSTVGSATSRALREEPTARDTVEAMLRGNIRNFTDPKTPSGCMIVLAAASCSAENGAVGAHLSQRRRSAVAALAERLEQAVDSGELPATTNVDNVAAFYATVLHGLSIEARDGVPVEQLAATVDHAMSMWDSLTGAPSGAVPDA